MGYLSDRVGRNFVLFINIAGTMCSYIWYIAVGKKPSPPFSPPFLLSLFVCVRACVCVCLSLSLSFVFSDQPERLILSTSRGASADSILARFFNVFPIEVAVIGPLVFLFTGFYHVTNAQTNALIADVIEDTAQR